MVRGIEMVTRNLGHRQISSSGCLVTITRAELTGGHSGKVRH